MNVHALADQADADPTAQDVFLEFTTFDALEVAANFGCAIRDAGTVEALAAVKEKLDEAIGALLSQEQVLIKKRELLQEMEKTTCRS